MNSTQQRLIITLASKNEGKRRELCRWLSDSSLPVDIALNEQASDVDETGSDFLENARLKAEQTPPVCHGGFVLGEDSGLVVDALNGHYGISPFPGLFSNRWLTPEIRDELLGQSFPNRMALDRTSQSGITNSDLCQGILALMAKQSNRTARYCCGMVLWHPERGVCFQTLQTTELQIIDTQPRGMNGFGYDPITVPIHEDGSVSESTMAELSTEEKNQISHRGRAFQKVLAYLKEQCCF
jgi:XTP/dITP diphosphohydrolase